MSRKTFLLPPTTAVRIVWALTGGFSNDPHSQRAAVYAEQSLKNIESKALESRDKEEVHYVPSAIVSMQATLRSLDTVYKGRDLNFDEVNQLRSAYLKSITDRIDFGKKTQDFLKSLPAMTIAGAGGVTVADALGLSGIKLWTFSLVLVAVGYLINLAFVGHARRANQMHLVKGDHERNTYYDQYVARVCVILEALYIDIDQIHHNVFGDKYPDPLQRTPQQVLEEMFGGVRPTHCKYIHKHMAEGKITPELWPLCETGTVERETAKKDPLLVCRKWEG